MQVNFIPPDHPALNYPNKITAKTAISAKHLPGRAIRFTLSNTFRMNDTMKRSDGSVIVANCGKVICVFRFGLFRDAAGGAFG